MEISLLNLTSVNEELLHSFTSRISNSQKKLLKRSKKYYKQGKATSSDSPRENVQPEPYHALLFFDIDDTLSPTSAIVTKIYEKSIIDDFDINITRSILEGRLSQKDKDLLTVLDEEAASCIKDCLFGTFQGHDFRVKSRPHGTAGCKQRSISGGKHCVEGKDKYKECNTSEDLANNVGLCNIHITDEVMQDTKGEEMIAQWVKNLLETATTENDTHSENDPVRSEDNPVSNQNEKNIPCLSTAPIIITAAGEDAFFCVLQCMPKLFEVFQLYSKSIRIFTNAVAETEAEKEAYKETIMKVVVADRLLDLEKINSKILQQQNNISNIEDVSSNQVQFLRIVSIGDGPQEQKACYQTSVDFQVPSVVVKFRDEEDFVQKGENIFRQVKDLRSFCPLDSKKEKSKGFYSCMPTGGSEVEKLCRLWQHEF